MVTLGISDDSTDALTRMSGTGVSTLRELAQWVPDIPPESLCLNVGTFSGAQRKSLEYRPLYYVLFGGPQGIYRTYQTHQNNCLDVRIWPIRDRI